jgi:hypothetical protein
MKLRTQFAIAVVGAVGFSLAGVAIADAVSPSKVETFISQSKQQPRLTSTAMLDRGGRHVTLSRQIGRVGGLHSLAITGTTTLADGTVLSAPPADASTQVSQNQAWNAFVAYGTPPNIYVLSSTPAPAIQLGQITKSDAPDGSTFNNELVWVVQYNDISLYTPISIMGRGPSPSANPADRTGYLDVFVDATTGQLLYTIAHDTN